MVKNKSCYSASNYHFAQAILQFMERTLVIILRLVARDDFDLRGLTLGRTNASKLQISHYAFLLLNSLRDEFRNGFLGY